MSNDEMNVFTLNSYLFIGHLRILHHAHCCNFFELLNQYIYHSRWILKLMLRMHTIRVRMILKVIFAIAATRINVLNGCSYAISVCDQVLTGSITCQPLVGGSSRMKDLGSASNVNSIFWGYPGQDATQGSRAKSQANLAEFCTNCSDNDIYDLSNVVQLSYLQPEHHKLYFQILASGLSAPHFASVLSCLESCVDLNVVITAFGFHLV